MSDDHEQIRGLCFEYTFRLDEGDFAGVGELLAQATLRPAMPGVERADIVGREQIERFYSEQVRTYSRGRPMTRHLITNQAITVSDDRSRASSRCYFTVLQRPPGLPYQIVVGGQDHDRFERSEGSWRFAEKTIEVDHLNAIEHHFRINT